MVKRALEGFVIAAACELPRGLRINLISPTVLKESLDKYASYFPGFPAVEGKEVGQVFKRSVLGIQTGQIYKVYG
jgi:NAD(P)-dependent dehydrogenase (short-subunit alcohol dehydrogenase family)